MWTLNIRIGRAELFTLASLPVVAALLVPAFMIDWTIALVPTMAYLVALGAAYTIYRRYAGERAAVVELATRFQVVDVRGVCPLGRREGDVVTIGPTGSVVPQLCAPAEAVLRLAAAASEERAVKEWCCPIYDHMLVFRRELKAA